MPGHRHKDSREKWTTTDTELEIPHPADAFTVAEVAALKLLLVAGGGGGTVPQPPNTPPTVPNIAPTGIAVSGVTTTGATVSWTTTDASTGLVQYGTTTGYGSATSATSSGTTGTRTLTSLTPGQTYHYRVQTTSGSTVVYSSDRTFTTTAITVPPAPPGAPTNLVATGGNTQVVLTWAVPSSNGGSAITGYRVFRNGTSIATPGNVLTYTATGLTNGTTYTLTVAAINSVGEGPQSGSASATPSAGGDINPPIISNVVVGPPTTTTCPVSWTLNEGGTGQVEYGTTTGYGQTTTLEASYLTSHSQTISPLLANTLYHLRIRSADAAGNLALSSDRTFTTASVAPPSGGYPPDTTLSYVATPGTVRPTYLIQTTDPTWGTQVIRISDQGAFGTSQTTLRHAYSKVQPWNADETYYLIGFLFPGHLLNGKTFARIRGISQPSDARWSNTNPDILYGTQSGNLFVKRLISTDVQSTVHAFNAAYSAMDIGKGEGNLSLDDRYVALTATRGGTTWIIVYDIVLNAVVVEKDMAGTTVYDCTMSPSGAYVVVSTPGGLDVYDRNMVYLRHLTSISAHYDVGYNAAGQEIAITSVGVLPTFRLSDGVQVNAYPANNTIIMGESHVSMKATSRPGWCVVTHYNQRTVDEGSDQVFAIKTDGSGTVEVYGFAHHNTSGAGAGYDAQPQAVPSKDLTRIAVASEWDQSPITNIYDYVMGMDVLR